MLLSECSAPYTLIISKPSFGLGNSPIALCLAPRASISPRLPAAEQQKRPLIPGHDPHPLLDVSQEGGRLSRVLLVRLQEPGILTLSLPASRARVDGMPSHHDEVPELRKWVLPAVTGPRAAAPHRPEPGLIHGEEDEDAEPEGEEEEGHGHGVRLVEVADPHDDRGLEVRVLGLAALAGGPGLEIEVAAASGVAEGLGAPRTESSLAAHRALKKSASASHTTSLWAPNQSCPWQLAELRRRPDPKPGGGEDADAVWYQVRVPPRVSCEPRE